jgi:hypothetical protein
MTAKEYQAILFLHWMNNPAVAVLLAVLVVWGLIWKGIALWKAARNGHTAWYVIMLIVNTVGILEIVYIFFFSKPKQN